MANYINTVTGKYPVTERETTPVKTNKGHYEQQFEVAELKGKLL